MGNFQNENQVPGDSIRDPLKSLYLEVTIHDSPLSSGHKKSSQQRARESRIARSVKYAPRLSVPSSPKQHE